MVNVSIVIHDNNIFPSVQDIRYDYSTQCWIARTLESWQKDFSDLRNIIDLLERKKLFIFQTAETGGNTNISPTLNLYFLIYDLQNLQFMKNGFIVLFGFVLFAFINDFTLITIFKWHGSFCRIWCVIMGCLGHNMNKYC